MGETNVPTGYSRWIDEWEKHEVSKQAIMIRAAADCQPYNTLIKQVKKAAKAEGLSVAALTALILERKHLRNAANVRNKLDDDVVAELEVAREQVPVIEGVEDMFAWAAGQLDEEIAEAKGKKKSPKAAASAKAKSDALDDLADDEFDRIGQENAEALGSGIRQLN